MLCYAAITAKMPLLLVPTAPPNFFCHGIYIIIFMAACLSPPPSTQMLAVGGKELNCVLFGTTSPGPGRWPMLVKYLLITQAR